MTIESMNYRRVKNIITPPPVTRYEDIFNQSKTFNAMYYKNIKFIVQLAIL